jgi:hypothetical protein
MEMQHMWDVKTKVTPVITGATTAIYKFFQKIPKQHTEKASNQGTTEHSHTGHSTHTSDDDNNNNGGGGEDGA